MIQELRTVESYEIIEPLLKKYGSTVVIQGVLEGNNLGRIYVDDPSAPTGAFVWAKNEMFYIIGEPNPAFTAQLESMLLSSIKREAMEIGETHFNLEVLSSEHPDDLVGRLFHHRFQVGERVPFKFQNSAFLQKGLTPKVASGYELVRINPSVIERDTAQVLTREIGNFWGTLDKFFAKGIGYAILQQNKVIGSCISVFVGGSDYEIGIHTYDDKHRGQGLATAMAVALVQNCVGRGGVPHWTTEGFRKDSIAIARKLGFQQLPSYSVYYAAFEDMDRYLVD
ncbi:GNAT family N-acetyltransferase [Paenibacillus paridis]|uniref:GNAT family N-acetyltransferase n=1 Tax=Paenibacillus paridis TaxID=2583376 RepID=UPI00111E9AC0|nr:GNAT family N-acetyltransferase [Paenibacillus paridis]